jgi:hypothetical protein
VDEVPTRKIVEAHAKAVVDGDMDAIVADFAPDMRGQVSDIAEQLPQPTTDADVRKVDVEDDHADVEIQYSNDDTSLTVRTRWEEIDGRPMIVSGEPVE